MVLFYATAIKMEVLFTANKKVIKKTTLAASLSNQRFGSTVFELARFHFAIVIIFFGIRHIYNFDITFMFITLPLLVN